MISLNVYIFHIIILVSHCTAGVDITMCCDISGCAWIKCDGNDLKFTLILNFNIYFIFAALQNYRMPKVIYGCGVCNNISFVCILLLEQASIWAAGHYYISCILTVCYSMTAMVF